MRLFATINKKYSFNFNHDTRNYLFVEIEPFCLNKVYRKYKFYGNISLSLGSNLELFHINKFIIIDHYNTVERLIKYDKLKFIILPDDIKKIFIDEDVNIVQLSVSVMFYIQNFTDSKIPYNICFDLYIMDVSCNSYDLDRKLFHLTRNNQYIIQVGANTTKSLLECIV
ncbi:hypothetical protein A3Q56_06052 [Intoshia linei]|uniref:Uncharacterized protein n=1 Tax=Intoshia linei TaxID=1819745 RepID=A0A177AW45_9BILA|nr:hypothetical protein A3Q56_06052 [Intoshia linei]